MPLLQIRNIVKCSSTHSVLYVLQKQNEKKNIKNSLRVHLEWFSLLLKKKSITSNQSNISVFLFCFVFSNPFYGSENMWVHLCYCVLHFVTIKF